MTKQLVGRGLLFALSAAVPLLIADAIWGVGVATAGLGLRLANMHWLFHFGTVSLSTLGAALGFQTLGGRVPSLAVAAVLGFLFGLVSIVGAPAALVFDDELGCAFWLFVGAMFASVGAAPFIERDAPASDASKR